MSISACLIVRDEEEFLPRCLDSLRGIVDEVVVVDTGSKDNTLQLARRWGAVTGTFPWIDDFAAARNASLDLARGDWILQVDADEELLPGGGHALREAIAISRAWAFTVGVHLAGDPAEPPSHLLRLFRRGLRYRRRVHENVTDDLADRGIQPSGDSGARLLHHGYKPQVLARRDKIRRNLELLEVVLREGGDAYDAFKHASTIGLRGTAQERRSSWERVLHALPPDAPSLAQLPWAARALAAAALDRGLDEGPSEALHLLMHHGGPLWDHPEVLAARMEWALLADRPEEAERCLRSWNDTKHPCPDLLEARVHLSLGRLIEASACLGRLDRPSAEVDALRLETLRQHAGGAACHTECIELFRRWPAHPEVQVACAAVLADCGDLSTARTLREAASTTRSLGGARARRALEPALAGR